MKGWIVFAVIVLLLFLLTLVRLGTEVTYSEKGLQLRIRMGRIWITLLPRKPKKPKKTSSGKEKKKDGETKQEKPEEKPEQKAEEPSAAQKHRGGLPIPLTELISLGVEAAGRTLHRLQIDTMEVEYLIGGKNDPASAAIAYGSLYAGGGAIVPLLENTFYRIRHREIQAWIDFDAEQSLIWLRLALSIRIGQLLSIGFFVVWRFLTAFLRQRKDNKASQEGMNHGTEAPNQ